MEVRSTSLDRPRTVEDLRSALAELHASSFGWAMACTKRVRADAEDVLQAAYAKVLSGAARYDGRSSIRTWLFGVIRITALEQQRRSIARILGLARWRAEPEAAPSAEEASVARERARAISAALAALADRQREVIHLVFYEGMSVREAAEAMGVSAGTASLHYDRGKERMRALLAEKGIEP